MRPTGKSAIRGLVLSLANYHINRFNELSMLSRCTELTPGEMGLNVACEGSIYLHIRKRICYFSTEATLGLSSQIFNTDDYNFVVTHVMYVWNKRE